MIEITEDLTKRICDYIQDGCTFHTAYLLCSVPATTGDYWRSIGRKRMKKDSTDKFAIFFQKTSEAKAQYIYSLIRCVTTAGNFPDNWQAAMRLLEARDPQHFSRFAKGEDNFKLSTNKSYPAQIKEVLDALNNGELDAMTANYFAQIIVAGANVTDKTDAKEILCEVLAKLKDEDKKHGKKMDSGG